MQKRLFVDAQAAIGERGFTVSLDRSDVQNGQLVVTRGRRRATLPWAKNQIWTDSAKVDLEGVVVFVPKLDRVFVPQQAVDWFARQFN
jgi:hypothetical protein